MTNTANQVASMEDELNYLRHELDQTKQTLAVVTADRDRLKIENSLLQSRARANQDKATRVETILSQVSMGLVAGLNEIRADRDTERASRREMQERTFEEETQRDAPPAFLRRSQPRDRAEQEASAYRGDREEPARIAPPVQRRAPTTQELRAPLDSKIDTTLASRDPRLPGGPEWGARPGPEIGSLEEMAARATAGR